MQQIEKWKPVTSIPIIYVVIVKEENSREINTYKLVDYMTNDDGIIGEVPPLAAAAWSTMMLLVFDMGMDSR